MLRRTRSLEPHTQTTPLCEDQPVLSHIHDAPNTSLGAIVSAQLSFSR